MKKFQPTFLKTLVVMQTIALLFIGINLRAQAGIASFGTPYTQDFTSLTTSTFNLTDNTAPFLGWYAFRTTTNAAPNVFTSSAGGTSTGQFYNFGTSSAADRAMGAVGSGSTGTEYYGVRLKNNTGAAINYLTVTYTGEQWRNGGNTTVNALTVEYQIGTTVTSLTGGTWTSIPALTFNSPINTASSGALDGNSAANRTANIRTTLAITINSGDEVFIRWTDIDHSGTDHGLAIDDVSITAVSPTNWYYSGSGNLNVLTNWSSNANGVGGTNPIDFSTGVQVFNILDNPSGTTTTISTSVIGTLTVANNCRVKLGGSTSNPITLTIASSNDITGNFDIDQSNTSIGNKVIIQSTVPSLSSLHSTSTVEFAGSGSQTFPAANYGNIVSSNSGARIVNGSIGIAGSYTPGTNTYTVTGSTVNFNGTSTQTIPTCTFENIRINNDCTLPNGNTLTAELGSTSFIVGSGKTLNVSGKIRANFTSTSSSYFTTTGSTINMLSGSEYELAADGGAIPTANWNANSTLNVTGQVAAASFNNRNQIFGKIIWNCTGQTAALTWPSSTLPGTFGTTGLVSVVNTGSSSLGLLGSAQVSVTVNSYSQSGGTASISTGTATADRTLIVSNGFTLSGGTLNLYTPTAGSLSYSGYLNIGGNFSHTAGSIINAPTNGIGSGVVSLNGASAQTITCNNLQLPSLTVNNSSGVTITSGTLSVNNALRLQAGLFTTNGGLRLLSSLTSTAYLVAIDGVTNTGSISGNVTVERFIPGGRRTARFLGHSFSTALSMASLVDNIYVTGDGTTAGTGGAIPGTGFDATTTNRASSFWFSNPLQAWTAFTTTNDASWTQYRGIRVLVRGDRTQLTTLTSATPPSPNAVTLDMTGTLNTGLQTITVPTGFSVFGNPYPSPVNLGARLSATANIGTQFWYWDAQAGPTAGAYRTKLVGSTASLPMSGAFVVQPTLATSIAFVESDKTATDTTIMFRTTTQSGVVELQVLYNNYPADNMFVRFNTGSIDNKDALDGDKLLNPEVNLYALSNDNQQLSLDTRPFAENKIIPLGFTATAANSFKIKVADYGITEEIYLKDKYLNVTTQLLAGTEYSFSVDPANAATLGNNRFELMMKTNSALPATFLNVTAAQKNAGIEVSFTTANETNMSNYEVEESTDGSTFSKATSIAANNATTNTYNWYDGTVINGDNYYRIKAVEKNGTAKYSNVVKVKIGGKGAVFTVYPNPVKGGVASLQMSNVEKGIYTVKIYNNVGQELAAKTINHNGGSATQTINLGKGIATGTYNMQITNGTTVITKTVIVE